MTYQQRIRDKLTRSLEPDSLDIHDDSARHSGHAGSHPLGETHFSIRIVSPSFSGLTRVARHRLIYEILAEELRERVHALTIEATSPADRNPE